MRWAH